MSSANISGPRHHKEKTKVVLVDCLRMPSGKSTLISALVHNLVNTQNNCHIVRNSYASCIVPDPGTAVKFDLDPPIQNPNPQPPTTTALDFLETQISRTHYMSTQFTMFTPPHPDLLILCSPFNLLLNTTHILQSLIDMTLISPPKNRHIPKNIPILLVGCKLDMAWRQIMCQAEVDGDDDGVVGDQNQKIVEKLFETRGMAKQVFEEYELDGYLECSGASGEGVKGVMDAVLGIVYSNRGVGMDGYCKSWTGEGMEGYSKSSRSKGKEEGWRSCCTML